jgi:hypothetical protein
MSFGELLRGARRAAACQRGFVGHSLTYSSVSAARLHLHHHRCGAV